MTREDLIDYVNHGREIEFKYKGKDYSITYYNSTDGKDISFCEFDKETTEVATAEELCSVTRDGVTVLEMLESITEDDIWIF